MCYTQLKGKITFCYFNLASQSSFQFIKHWHACILCPQHNALFIDRINTITEVSLINNDFVTMHQQFVYKTMYIMMRAVKHCILHNIEWMTICIYHLWIIEYRETIYEHLLQYNWHSLHAQTINHSFWPQNCSISPIEEKKK